MRMKAAMLAVCFMISVVVLAECSPVPEYLIIREVHNLPLFLINFLSNDLGRGLYVCTVIMNCTFN